MKKIEVRLDNGEIHRADSIKELNEKFGGIGHIGDKARGDHPWNIACKGKYKGRKIVMARFPS